MYGFTMKLCIWVFSAPSTQKSSTGAGWAVFSTASFKCVSAAGSPPDETLLVLDATTGQNGIAQARAFTEAVEVTGVALTKLDGTAKGGVVLAVRDQLGVPVKLVGTGEGVGDLEPFDADVFAARLLGG